MKQRTIRSWIAVLCVTALLAAFGAGAYGAEADGDFRYTMGTDGITLTDYTGSAANLTIPSQIDGRTVTAIGEECFQGKICLKRVHLPEGIRQVGSYAFETCSALERVYLPETLTDIGDGAFSGCGHLTLVDMQDQVTRIGSGAFLCCDALVHVELSAALQQMGEFAFAGCSSLARVTFDGSRIARIPDRAFYGCEALTGIVLPKSVTFIGKRAFSGCRSLRSFYHGTPLTELGTYAFENCESMTTADVSAPVLRRGTLDGCNALEYLTLRDGVTGIEAFAFQNSSVQDLTLSGTVTAIEPGAFYGSRIRSMTAEEGSAYRIDHGALVTADGKTLVFWMPEDPYAEEPTTEFAVPEGITALEEYSFAFSPLETVKLPGSLREIRAWTFANSKVQGLDIPEGVKVDPNAFRSPEDPEEPGKEEEVTLTTLASGGNGTTVTTRSAAGDKSLYRAEDYKDYREIGNEDFDAWCEEYLDYNEKQGNPIREDLIPYIIRYKGEVVPHFMAMTAVQNRDPEMWASAASYFGDDFESMYRMMNHGLFAELRRGRMKDDLVLYSGVYDSQLMAAAGTKTVPTQQQLIDAIGRTFSDPVMISTSTDAAVACGFGETLFLIYASREAMEAQGAVCMDAVVHSSERETLMAANARYRVLDVGEMTVTHQDPWEETAVTDQRSYVRLELLGPESPANPFVDVSEGRFYYEPVLWAVENGITKGIDATHFAPESSATRAQLVTFLWAAAGRPEPESKQNPFVDVPAGAYYAKAVLWAAENHITSGMDKTHFAPGRPCSRGEFVTFLYAFRGKPKTQGANPFRDVSKGRFYYDAVRWAVENGVTSGIDATHFAPEKNCTRGETVTFLRKALDRK